MRSKLRTLILLIIHLLAGLLWLELLVPWLESLLMASSSCLLHHLMAPSSVFLVFCLGLFRQLLSLLGQRWSECYLVLNFEINGEIRDGSHLIVQACATRLSVGTINRFTGLEIDSLLQALWRHGTLIGMSFHALLMNFILLVITREVWGAFRILMIVNFRASVEVFVT